MKLREVFENMSFADIADCLVMIDGGNRTYIDAYRTAFEALRRTPAVENDGVISVELKKLPGTGDRICFRNCEGDSWERNLGKELSVGKDIRIPECELAARALCAMTFYGINGKDREEFCKNLSLCHFLSGVMLNFAAQRTK